MIIEELLKEYDAKFSIEENGKLREINDNILANAQIIKNNNNEFVLHETDDDGLFELIVKPADTVIYNYYDIDGELYMSHSYSNDGCEIAN